MLVKAAAGIVIVGVLALSTLSYLAYHFQWRDYWPHAGQPYATAFAGIAAICAAFIALHNGRSQLDEMKQQRNQDQSRWEDERQRNSIKDLRQRFSDITSQLADNNPAIRLSGAYAMAALAQDWRDVGDADEVKVCISVPGWVRRQSQPDLYGVH